MDEDGRAVEKGIENWRPVNALLREHNQIERVPNLSIKEFTAGRLLLSGIWLHPEIRR